ncbi:MAG: hypothetical protein IKA22_07130 [Lentisphaeria bacterium]|nr:hypothetical protein [Lentisphaeria bacterium]
MENIIKDFLSRFYSVSERPALEAQIELFSTESFLKGKKVLDATPVFRNTLNKYLVMLACGMDLTVGYGGKIPYDAEIVAFLRSIGVRTVENGTADETFDFVLDCAGVNADVETEYGVSELTRSGFYQYQDKNKKVFLADSSRIKSIETALGTGDGFLRAMQKLGYGDLRGRKIIIFGCGKVGFGVAMYCAENGADVYAVDDWQNRSVPHKFHMVSRFDRRQIDDLTADAFCVVSATGIYGGLTQTLDLQKLVKSDALIANIGVEDEFAGLISKKRILNDNQPLNFILEEPTHLKFIDPTMALHNAGMKILFNAADGEKFILPDEKINDFYLNIVRKHGIINKELDMLEKYSCQE